MFETPVTFAEVAVTLVVVIAFEANRLPSTYKVDPPIAPPTPAVPLVTVVAFPVVDTFAAGVNMAGVLVDVEA
jgi:hypothetical protein